MTIRNGTLYAPSYDSTGNPGEYTISGAVISSLTCPDGAYNLEVGWVVWSIATDPNTGSVVPGVAQRYRITSITPTDSGVCDLTLLWDELGLETNWPTNGALSVFSEVSSNYRFGYPVSEFIYPDIPSGISVAILNEETLNITDKIVSGGGGAATKLVKLFDILEWSTTAENTLSLQITNTLGTSDCLVMVYEVVSASVFLETTVDIKIDAANITLSIVAESAFSGKLVAI